MHPETEAYIVQKGYDAVSSFMFEPIDNITLCKMKNFMDNHLLLMVPNIINSTYILGEDSIIYLFATEEERHIILYSLSLGTDQLVPKNMWLKRGV